MEVIDHVYHDGLLTLGLFDFLVFIMLNLVRDGHSFVSRVPARLGSVSNVTTATTVIVATRTITLDVSRLPTTVTTHSLLFGTPNNVMSDLATTVTVLHLAPTTCFQMAGLVAQATHVMAVWALELLVTHLPATITNHKLGEFFRKLGWFEIV